MLPWPSHSQKPVPRRRAKSKVEQIGGDVAKSKKVRRGYRIRCPTADRMTHLPKTMPAIFRPFLPADLASQLRHAARVAFASLCREQDGQRAVHRRADSFCPRVAFQVVQHLAANFILYSDTWERRNHLDEGGSEHLDEGGSNNNGDLRALAEHLGRAHPGAVSVGTMPLPRRRASQDMHACLIDRECSSQAPSKTTTPTPPHPLKLFCHGCYFVRDYVF